jgi:hypothetical protein
LPIGAVPEIVILVKCLRSVRDANISVGLYDREGLKLGLAFSWDDGFYLSLDPGSYSVVVKLNKFALSPGQYYLGVGLNQSTSTQAWDGISYYPIFEVENQSNVTHYPQRSWGINHYSDNTWSVKQVSND